MSLPLLMGILIVIAFLAVILILVFMLQTIKFNKGLIAQQEVLAAYENGTLFSAKQTEAVNATLAERVETIKAEYATGIQNGTITLPAALISAIEWTDERKDKEYHEQRQRELMVIKEADEAKSTLNSLKEISLGMRTRISELEEINGQLSAKNVQLLSEVSAAKKMSAQPAAAGNNNELSMLCTAIGQGEQLDYAEAMKRVQQKPDNDNAMILEELEQCKHRIKLMTDRLGALNTTNAELQEQLNQQANQQPAVVVDSESQAQISELQAELTKQTEQLERATMELIERTNSLSALDEENRLLLIRLEDAAEMNNASKASAEANESASAELTKLTATIDELTETGKQQKKEISILTLKLATAQAEANRAKTALAEAAAAEEAVPEKAEEAEAEKPVAAPAYVWTPEPPFPEVEYLQAIHRRNNKNMPGAITPKMQDWTIITRYEEWLKAKPNE